MARYRCPSCGEAYDGKRCRHCFYERFSEEISCGNHTHKGEPLVIREPVRRPIPGKDPVNCKTRRKKKTAGSPKLGLILALVVALVNLSGILLENVSFGPDPVPEPLPEQLAPVENTLLYQDDQFRITTSWTEGDPIEPGIPLYLSTDIKEEFVVFADQVVVNGYAISAAGVADEYPDHEPGIYSLHIDEDELACAGIDTIAQVSFRLVFYKADGFLTLGETETIRLCAQPDYVQPVDDSGSLLWQQGDIRIVARGYVPSEYDPQTLTTGTLEFFLENTGHRTLEVFTTGVSVNGEESKLLGMWCQLPPNTWTIARMYLTDLEQMDISDLSQIRDLRMQLCVQDRNDPENVLFSDDLSIPF